MGRLVGDGAMYWYLQEIIILPQFQRKGIGTMIVNYLVDYARENSIVSAKYSCGFSNPLVPSIIVGERYLDYFTTITEDRL